MGAIVTKVAIIHLHPKGVYESDLPGDDIVPVEAKDGAGMVTVKHTVDKVKAEGGPARAPVVVHTFTGVRARDEASRTFAENNISFTKVTDGATAVKGTRHGN